MKFIELRLRGTGNLMMVNVCSIKHIIKQRSGGTYISFVDDTAKTVHETYEEIQELIGFHNQQSVYNNQEVEFKC